MVTFETKVWEKDWRYILKGDYLDKMISRCNYPFTKKILIINNVVDRVQVSKFAKEKVNDGVIDAYYFAEDYADVVLNYFKIDKDSFDGGYYYSIAELVSIYLCDTPFLLHFSSDSLLQKKHEQWIDKAITIFSSRTDIVVANPTWDFLFHEAQQESISELDDFYVGQGFSDQCYLIRMDVFKNEIYSENNLQSDRYPKYGGCLFEKRVDSFMRNHDLFRITSKDVSYIHRNFPTNRIWSILNIYIKYIIKKRLS
jgi:hypothetical protein